MMTIFSEAIFHNCYGMGINAFNVVALLSAKIALIIKLKNMFCRYENLNLDTKEYFDYF